jgi:hypothetical protein
VPLAIEDEEDRDAVPTEILMLICSCMHANGRGKEPRLSVKRTEVVRRKDPRDSERDTSRPATHGSVDDDLVVTLDN